MTKTIDALKLAEEALEGWKEYDTWTDQQMWNDDDEEALAAIREAKAELEKQEPVAWMYDDGTSHKFIEPVLSVKRKDFPDGWRERPLYAAQVSVEAAVLAEREACAKVCEQDDFQIYETAERCAAAIRARGNK